jgi:predicted metalloprotease with PDZ domain
MRLGWPQFVALVAGLCTVAVVLAIIMERDISEALSRLEVRQYEQEFGFEVGLVKGFPMGPTAGMWGIARVTPGGAMDRAGMRSGDLVFNRHGYDFTELSSAISEAVNGRTACVFVMSTEEARTGSGRDVCLKGKIKQ